MYAGLFLADAVPLRLGMHEESDASPSEDLRHPATERAIKRTRDPVATDACLFEHQVRGTERDVREAFLRARVGDVEAAQVAPELDALIQVGHEQFGDERGFEGFSHWIIVAVLAPRAVPVADRV